MVSPQIDTDFPKFEKLEDVVAAFVLKRRTNKQALAAASASTQVEAVHRTAMAIEVNRRYLSAREFYQGGPYRRRCSGVCSQTPD
jgi:hypothetical protein